MGILSPLSPVRADHRYIQTLMQSILGGKVEQVPEECSMVSRVFLKAGGSWQRLFQGSPEDTILLKRILRHAFKTKRLTPKRNWKA